MTKEQSTIYVGIDVSKDKLAVAIAGGGGGGSCDEVLNSGKLEKPTASVDKLLKKLFGGGGRLGLL